jgi:hypothetical protein
MRNPSQTWQQTHSSEFLQRLLPASVVASLYPSSYLDTVMHNDHAYDKKHLILLKSFFPGCEVDSSLFPLPLLGPLPLPLFD